jgi:DNA segregation ATPase FtsK/SpoIIIE-like protein
MTKQDDKIQNLEDRVRRIEEFLGASRPFLTISDSDETLTNAKEIVMKYDKASASLLQRRLGIGYARAARLLDQLEELGVVGPGCGSQPREVYKNIELKLPRDKKNGHGRT